MIRKLNSATLALLALFVAVLGTNNALAVVDYSADIALMETDGKTNMTTLFGAFIAIGAVIFVGRLIWRKVG